jgi:hypothetical protein
LATEKKRSDDTLKDRFRSAVLASKSQVDCPLQPCAQERIASALATFRRKKPFLDDRATDLGARTRRQIAAGKV